VQPNGHPARLLRVILLGVALAMSIVLLFRSSGTRPAAIQADRQRLEIAELEQAAAATWAMGATTSAAKAHAATKPALARAEAFRSRVKVERTGQLRLQDSGADTALLVVVPPLVTDRLRADSAAISALSLALTSDSMALASQEALLMARAKINEAARRTIASLERERQPRCGRRCGMVLGAVSIVALGVALDQTRRLLYH
jgi:hypothetical protein